MPRPNSLLLFSLVLLGATLPAAAQKFAPKAIQFTGDPEYTDAELLAAANLKPGEVYSSADLNDRSQVLMGSGMFSSLTYKFDGVNLVFTLKPSEQLYPLRFLNLPLVDGPDLEAKLRTRVPLYHGKVATQEGVETGGVTDGVLKVLAEMLAAQGIKATLITMPGMDIKQHKVTSTSVSITDPPMLVGELRMDPASPALEPRAQQILAGLSGGAYDVEGTPNQISVNVGNYYRDKGYIEADVQATPLPSAKVGADGVHIPFNVTFSPGQQYKIGAIKLAPDLVLTQADFDHQSGIHPGDVADHVRVVENWEYIARQYHNKGYMRALIQPTPAFDRAQSTVTYTVDVVPGPAYIMGKLTIQNVSDDLRAAMLAAWKMPAGAPFNEGAVKNLYTIGDINPQLKRVFSAVTFRWVFTLNDQNHTVDVTLRLEKKQ